MAPGEDTETFAMGDSAPGARAETRNLGARLRARGLLCAREAPAAGVPEPRASSTWPGTSLSPSKGRRPQRCDNRPSYSNIAPPR
jgi:hypothetical protein